MSNGGIIGPVNDPTSTTVTTSFTVSGTYNYPNQATPGEVDYLVVAGGGGGGSTNADEGGAGGGGAGGYRTSFPGGTKLAVPLSAGCWLIPPAPPPVDVIVENIDGEPSPPLTALGVHVPCFL